VKFPAQPKLLVMHEHVRLDGGSEIVIMDSANDRNQRWDSKHESTPDSCWICHLDYPHSTARHRRAVKERENPWA
jgi:hypothetical protein